MQALLLAVRGDFDYHFVAPERYFDMPKVAAFRSWLEDCVRAFPPPETEAVTAALHLQQAEGVHSKHELNT